jgi:hypothetical protein
MRNSAKFGIFMGAVLVLSSPVFAHHGAANYDTEKSVTLTGTVTDLQFTNPHVLVSVNVKDPSTGKVVEWRGELTSPNRLSRSGWSKNTLKPGDQVTLSGNPSKSGAPTMAISKLRKGDQEISTR